MRKIRLSILRAAYLAAFSWFGYRYALNKHLDIVRAQLVNPDEDLIPGCALNLLDRDVGVAEPLIALMTDPCEGVLVLLPAGSVGLPVAATVILPTLQGDGPFYDGLAACYTAEGTERRMTFTATPLGWPTGPHLSLDFR